MTKCHFCEVEILDPTARGIYVRVSGWQTKGSGETRRSGSDIVLREPGTEIACGTCINRLKSRVHTGQRGLLDDVEERTPPLCNDCHAEVTWVTLTRSQKRVPVDRRALHKAAPRRSQVLVDATGSLGVVLRQSDIDSGAAQKRLDAGASLYRMHRISCTAERKAA